MTMPWTIEKLEHGKAILNDGQNRIIISRSQIPDNAKEGDSISAEFYFTKDEKKRQDNLARALLEEIVGKAN